MHLWLRKLKCGGEMRSGVVRAARGFLLAVMLLAILTIGVLAWPALSLGDPPWLAWVRAHVPGQALAGRRIGIIAGHSGYDPGAVCDDGLTEAAVNAAIAQGVAAELRGRGATVDILEEFDDRLTGYRAQALVAIHADSCQVDLSGFKVAAKSGDAAARLGDCLWDRYAAATGLPRHLDTITPDMLEYHAFRQIAGGTPAAIIETGFLKRDRAVLSGPGAQPAAELPGRASVGSDGDSAGSPAAGIAAGVECFLEARPGRPAGQAASP